MKQCLRILLLAALFVSCGKEHSCRVPIGEATCQIDPNSPLYPGINNCDGYEYLVGGYQGIVVVRTGWESFVAYERTCPADTGRLEMAEGYGNIVLECPKCHSQFNTFAGGEPLNGSHSSCFLQQYNTYYDGQTLYISNY